jgi:TetR/AcrR family transcriptional repressor of nem operon
MTAQDDVIYSPAKFGEEVFMARAQFDRDDVLDKAIDLFWQRGFSAASMQQVVTATGLQPGSIYLAFGSKEGLFREALERYAEKTRIRVRAALDGAPGVGEGICMILEAMMDESTKDDYCSCFLIKTQLELAAERNELYALASAKLADVEAIFRSYLEREFDAELSKKRAISLMLHIFGMRVYGYQPDSVVRVRQGLREGLPWLPWS